MTAFEGLPDSRTSLKGLTDEGDEAWLIRGIAGKLYRCPGCHGEVAIGDDHVIVQYVRRLGGTEHHHWHRRCVEELLVPALSGVERVSASESKRGRLESRGRVPAGLRRRPLTSLWAGALSG
jgi:hypothetical protein